MKTSRRGFLKRATVALVAAPAVAEVVAVTPEAAYTPMGHEVDVLSYPPIEYDPVLLRGMAIFASTVDVALEPIWPQPYELPDPKEDKDHTP